MTDELLDYVLPERLIAQHPAEPRDAARLLVVRRDSGTLEHRSFRDLPDYLRAGDLLVLNDTRVLPARLRGRRERTGGKWEGLYLRSAAGGAWELLCKSGGRPEPGEWVAIDPGPLRLRLIARTAERGGWLAEPDRPGTVAELLATHGTIPLPPYIRKGEAVEADRERYQTVYADRPGSVAAPTAGLHFTPALFDRLATAGVARAAVTLHVGPGTFRPIDGDPASHPMHAEWCEVPATTAEAMRACRAAGGRVVAVGTTTVRTLETSGGAAWAGETALYVRPPYSFRAIDAMVTNFHLPRSTLLLLVAAFAGRDLLLRAYREAIAADYRFYSYGDAMLVV